MSERALTRSREPGRAPAAAPSEVPQYAYGWLVYVGGALLALLLAFVIYKLHYSYGQAPHRIVKMLLGLAVFLVVFFRPRLALHVWLLAIPLGEYLPVTGIPGLNGPNLLFLIIMASWVVPCVLRGTRVFTPARLAAPIGAFIAMMLISFGKASLFPVGGTDYSTVIMLKMVWQSVLGFAVYFAVVNMVEDKKQVRDLLVTLAIGCAIAAVVALRQYVTTPDHRRIAGTIGDINDLGAYFAVCASMLVGLLFAARSFPFFRRLVIQVSTALTAVAVFLPKSRGALVAVVCGLGFVSYVINKKALIVFLIILAASPLWAPTFVKDRMAETRMDSVEAGLVGDATDRLDPSSAVRLEIWASAMRAFARSPIIGYGYRTVPLLTYEDLGRPYSAHSLYVETACETGIVGLAILVWLIVACFMSGRELLALGSSPLARGLAGGFLAATVALVVANVFGQRFTHMSIAGTYFFAAALVDRSIRFERTGRSHEGEKGVTTP